MTTTTTAPTAESAARSEIKHTAEQLKDDGHSLVKDAREHAEAYAEAQKDHVAGRIGGVADALRDTSRKLRNQDEEAVAGLTDTAADQLERASVALRQKDLGTMLSEASDLARSHPAIFLGGAVALGFVAGRFLRAGGEPDDNASASTQAGG